MDIGILNAYEIIDFLVSKNSGIELSQLFAWPINYFLLNSAMHLCKSNIISLRFIMMHVISSRHIIYLRISSLFALLTLVFLDAGGIQKVGGTCNTGNPTSKHGQLCKLQSGTSHEFCKNGGTCPMYSQLLRPSLFTFHYSTSMEKLH